MTLPLNKTKRKHMYRYLHTVTSFQHVAHLGKKTFSMQRYFEQIVDKQRNLEGKFVWYFWSWTTEIWLCLQPFFSYKDSVWHSSDWFMFLDISNFVSSGETLNFYNLTGIWCRHLLLSYHTSCKWLMHSFLEQTVLVTNDKVAVLNAVPLYSKAVSS